MLGGEVYEFESLGGTVKKAPRGEHGRVCGGSTDRKTRVPKLRFSEEECRPFALWVIWVAGEPGLELGLFLP